MKITRKMYLGFMFVLLVGILYGCTENGNAAKGDEDSKKVFELELNNWASSTHHLAYNVYEPWKKIVEEKTEGRVKVNISHGAALGAATTVYQDVKGGLYDVGMVVTTYSNDTELFPYTIGNLPFAFEGSKEAAKVLEKFGEKYVNKEVKDFVIMGGPTATDPYSLFSAKPINSYKDLEKMKIRVSSKNEVDFIKELGAVPVNLPVAETYEALQKHTVDSALYTFIGSVGMKFFEPGPHILVLNSSVTPTVQVMNKDFFDSLPEDLQKLFEEELNPKLSELVKHTYETEYEAAYESLEKDVSKRGEITIPSEKDMKKYKEAGKVAWDAWIEEANKKGYPGEEMVKDFTSMLEEEGYPVPY
ncbi:TRAP transporter substrate-binding protein DctP [Sporosarcina sp. P33]|uniref:TRAP transporter substrate-binding protein DctP n=1 Tax=Sporosarcina sp. P33 TaxID=1930764 RepID=UPI0009BD88B1|nr:TRAP transporter substrate-binding protein DctP [Sporosarcina sp. P33]ARD47061.1 hypothetical protein SporoP33_01575 [Sporosarcina sp. P33]